MATFTFRIIDGLLRITKTGERSIGHKASSSNNEALGCKRSITWNEMQKVPVPPDFQIQQGDVNTEDIWCLPKEGAGAKLSKLLDDRLGHVERPPANDETAAERAKEQKSKRKQYKF